MSVPSTLPATESEITAFLAAFEDGSLPKQCWTHGAHLLAGAWYVHQLGEARALNHMRTCVQRYNVAVGGQNTATDGYHETVTVFWIKLLATHHNPGEPRAAFAHRAVHDLVANRTIYADFYDYDILASPEARRTWQPPNLRPL